MTKYCSHCGQEIHEEAVVCVHCGCQVPQNQPEVVDNPSMGLKILSLIIPIAGLLLFFIHIGSKPVSARAYGIWGVVGFCIAVCLELCLEW